MYIIDNWLRPTARANCYTLLYFVCVDLSIAGWCHHYHSIRSYYLAGSTACSDCASFYGARCALLSPTPAAIHSYICVDVTTVPACTRSSVGNETETKIIVKLINAKIIHYLLYIMSLVYVYYTSHSSLYTHSLHKHHT